MMSSLDLRDTAMPTLQIALDLGAMQSRLATLLGADYQLRAVDVLKYKPGRRCALAYTLQTPAGQARVFGKVFATGRGAGILLTQGRIFDALDPAVLRIPRPLGYLADLKLLLTEFLEGHLLADELYRGDTVRSAQRMGAALAAFHHSGVICAKRWTIARELSNAVRTCEESMLEPGRARAIELEIRRAAATVPVVAEVPVHRDYYLDQLFDCDQQTALFDLDDARQGEAALDLGNFLAHLTLRPLQFPEVTSACAAARAPFLASYCSAASPIPGLMARTCIYEATSLLRLAGVYAGRPRWADSIPVTLMDRCESVLSREDS